MKKLFGLFFITMLLSCSNAVNDKHSVTEEQHQKHDEYNTLALNNGVKWQADSSTSANVSSLQFVIQTFYDSNNVSLPAYKAIAVELQFGLNEMIRECKMKGRDHDALHKWLEPLLQQVKELARVDTVSEAKQILAGIDQQVNRYNQFFK